MQKKIETTTMVRVDCKIKKRVAKKVEGTRKSIGAFYDEAAKEKLKPIKKSI